MIELKRGNTWDFLCNLKLDGVKQDLRLAKIYFSLKTELTDPVTDPDDTSATLNFDASVPDGPDPIYDYSIVIDFPDTTVALGTYYIGIQYKLGSGKVYEVLSEKCKVVYDVVNRTA